MSDIADPIINALNRPFWDAAAAGTLVLPHCVTTGAAFWPPSPLSPYAAGEDVEWRGVTPVGHIESVVVYRRAFQAAFANRLPYGIALVMLRCGVRLQAHIETPDDYAAPRSGDEVVLRFLPSPTAATPLLVATAIN